MDLHIPEQKTLISLLNQEPDGISEYSLLERLSEQGQLEMPDTHGDLGGLFRAHFLLFHSLYRLRDHLWEQQSGHLEISPLSISLHPYSEGKHGLAETDALRSYYLNLDHLYETTDLQVAEMIARFWHRLSNPDQRKQALAELGLEDPVDDDTIRRRYKELAMQHHPDRGGDTVDFQSINQAMDQLKQLKRK